MPWSRHLPIPAETACPPRRAAVTRFHRDLGRPSCPGRPQPEALKLYVPAGQAPSGYVRYFCNRLYMFAGRCSTPCFWTSWWFQAPTTAAPINARETSSSSWWQHRTRISGHSSCSETDTSTCASGIDHRSGTHGFPHWSSENPRGLSSDC